PSRLLGAAGLLSLLVAAVLLAFPAVHYLRHQTVEEWMIYRFVVGNLLGVVGVLLLCAGHLAGTTVDAFLFGGRPPGRLRAFAARALGGPIFWWVEGALLVGGGLLVLPSFQQLVRTRATYTHWSRFIAMSFFYETAAILAITKIAISFLGLAAERAEYERNAPSVPAALTAPVSKLFDDPERYDDMLQRGLKLSGEPKEFFIRGRLEHIRRRLPQGALPKRILDFGCGVGDASAVLADIFPGASVVGVDVAEAAVQKADATLSSERVAFGTLELLDETEPFDLCY